MSNSTSSQRDAFERDSLVTLAKESFSVKLILTGILFILTGYVIQTGMWAALLPIWGGGLVLVGTGAITLIWLLRR